MGLCRSKQSNSGWVISYYHLLYIDIIINHADIYVASAPTLNISCFCNPSGGSGRMPRKPGSMGSYRKLMQDHLLWQVFDASQDHYKWEMPKPMKIICFFSRTSLWGAVIVVLEKCHLRLCHFKCKHVIKPVYISTSSMRMIPRSGHFHLNKPAAHPCSWVDKAGPSLGHWTSLF